MKEMKDTDAEDYRYIRYQKIVEHISVSLLKSNTVHMKTLNIFKSLALKIMNFQVSC